MNQPLVRIHSSAEVSPLATIGRGTSIWNDSQVREGVSIGEECIIGKGVYIDFDVQVGDRVKIQNGVHLFHGTTVETGVFIGPGVIVTNDKNPRAINPDGSLKGNDDWQVGPVKIGYGASVGAGSIILPNVNIGRFALIGAGSVVTRNVADYSLVIGNPAHSIGYVCKCGARLIAFDQDTYLCPDCGWQYSIRSDSKFVEARS